MKNAQKYTPLSSTVDILAAYSAEGTRAPKHYIWPTWLIFSIKLKFDLSKMARPYDIIGHIMASLGSFNWNKRYVEQNVKAHSSSVSKFLT
jgi:hypothetical protein